MSADRGRVVLHVGVPKSGTTFLQTSLAARRKALAAAGFLYPRDAEEAMFAAALDVRGNHKSWGRRRGEVEGAWDRLARSARRHSGTTVLSHELLAATSARRAAGAMSMLRGLEVHVVVTARDPARQLVAEWQERIKHGRKLGFAEFSERVMSPDGEQKQARRFWAAQDLPDVLARWGAGLPPAQVHVVCCPPAEADPLVLWRRFAQAVGFDADALAPAGPGRSNSSLGVVQIDLLRRVNLALDGRIVPPAYGPLVKHWFAGRLLAAHRSPRPALPSPMYDVLVDVGSRWVKEIDRAGYVVHGDAADLVPVPPAHAAPHPDDVDPAAEVDTAAAVIADLLLEVGRLRADR